MARFVTDTGNQVERRTEIKSLAIQGWQEGWLPQLQKTGIPANSISDLLNVEWNDDYTLSKRRGFRQIADDSVAGLGEADFVLAPRVYTTQGEVTQYTQQELNFNRSNGLMFYQSLGKLWQEVLAAVSGGDLTTSDRKS